MKKAILSGSLILIFILYGLHERQEDSSAQVDDVSGASDTSQAFIQSLSVALNQAKSHA